MNTRKQILQITQTAMLLAIAVLSQAYLTNLLGGPGSPAAQLAVGSIVNFCLVLAALACGFWSGAAISGFTPFIAFLLGRVQWPQQILVLALGNAALVFVFWLICNKKIFGKNSNDTFNWGVAAVLGSFAKFAVLWFGMTRIFIQFVLTPALADEPQRLVNMTATITAMFTWPQLATALTGCIIAGVVYRVLKPVLHGKMIHVQN